MGGCAMDKLPTSRLEEEKRNLMMEETHSIQIWKFYKVKKKRSNCLFQFTHVPCGKGPYHKLI